MANAHSNEKIYPLKHEDVIAIMSAVIWAASWVANKTAEDSDAFRSTVVDVAIDLYDTVVSKL